MNKLFSILLILAVHFLYIGCAKDAETQQPCTFDSCEYKAPLTEIAAVEAHLDSAGITGTTPHCSGLFYKIETSGTGKSPDPCQNTIIAHYKGTLTNGNVFDSGQFEKAIPLGELIGGWIVGLPLIKEGGRITLYVPPSLGYGREPQYDRGTLKIPANSVLVFDVELLTVY